MLRFFNLDLIASLSDVRVSEGVATWLAEDQHVNCVSDIYRDVGRHTDLQVRLLKHIALDAGYSQCREDFMFVSLSGDETTFMLRLYNRDNFLGTEFTLETGSPEYQKMIAAIDANLASRMFKAASMAVRLSGISHSRRFAERVRERTVAEVREAEVQRLAADPGAVPLSEPLLQSRAFPLWRKRIDVNTKHRWARIGKVVAHTSDLFTQGNPNDAMLLFALQYFVPKELQ
jgi:hypothetical protein